MANPELCRSCKRDKSCQILDLLQTRPGLKPSIVKAQLETPPSERCTQLNPIDTLPPIVPAKIEIKPYQRKISFNGNGHAKPTEELKSPEPVAPVVIFASSETEKINPDFIPKMIRHITNDKIREATERVLRARATLPLNWDETDQKNFLRTEMADITSKFEHKVTAAISTHVTNLELLTKGLEDMLMNPYKKPEDDAPPFTYSS